MLYLTELDGRKTKVREVTNFAWKPALKGDDLQGLRCTCCEHRLGTRQWGFAWIFLDGFDKNGRGARLCFDCAQETEKLKELVRCPKCFGNGPHALSFEEVCGTCKGKNVVTKKVYDAYLKKN